MTESPSDIGQLYKQIEELLEENQDLLDTFRAIYDKLGIREGGSSWK